MAAPDPLDTFRRRAVRHAFEDGTIDLVLGLYTLMVGVATQRPVFLALSTVYLVLMRTGWRFLNMSVAGRRTGYAELPVDPPAPLLSVILLAGLLTMGVVAGLTLFGGRLWSLNHWPAWMPLVSGATLAAGFVNTAAQSGLVRYRALALLCVGVSVFFWLFPFGPRINPSDRLTLSLFVTAALLLASGAVALVRFLKARPVVAVEDGHAG